MTNENTTENKTETPKDATVPHKPELKVYKKDAEGKKIVDSEIALWKNISNDGKVVYYSGKDKEGNKYVAFVNEPN